MGINGYCLKVNIESLQQHGINKVKIMLIRIYPFRCVFKMNTVINIQNKINKMLVMNCFSNILVTVLETELKVYS